VIIEAARLAAGGLKVHFNISGKSLGSRLLISDLVRTLRDTGADPGLLVCEITETTLASDEAAAQWFAHEFAALGCGMVTFPQIVIDGQSVGGFDELLAADRAGRLGELVRA